MYVNIHVHVVMYLYVHSINISVPCSDTYVPFCSILSRWVGFQMHTRTSEHIRRATALFLPAPGRPACTLLARLHPAGAAHSLQQQDTLGQEQINLFICRQLQGSPKAEGGPPRRQQQSHWQHWQRPQAAQSSTATLFG